MKTKSKTINYTNSKTITLSGLIEKRWDSAEYEKIKLIQPDYYKVDLINRFEEIKESFDSKLELQINFWISNFYKLNEYSNLTQEEQEEKNNEILNQNFSKELVQELWLNHLYNGKLISGYEQVNWRYSEWTSGEDYNSYLKIGNHDLFKEIGNHQGEFIVLDINIKY